MGNDCSGIFINGAYLGVPHQMHISVYRSYDIVDVNILVENKVVEVTFADGTKQKSVCMEPDTFSLETAIAVCISKKLIGGTKNYNDAIRKGVKFYENKLKNQKELEELQKSIEAKKAKRRAKKQKRAAKEREEKIAIQTEAYIRALRATGNVKYTDDLKQENSMEHCTMAEKKYCRKASMGICMADDRDLETCPYLSAIKEVMRLDKELTQYKLSGGEYEDK